MARLSGLASDHHPEGPGDARRPRRARTSKTPSVEMAPAAKRPASPTSESAYSHVKRHKRVRVSDTEQLAQEQEDAVSREHAGDHTVVTQTTHIETTRHARRHSEPLGAVHEDDENDEDELHQQSPPATQPLPGLTPHLDRLHASRGRPANVSRRARVSMPAQLRINTVDDVDANERQFAPLSAVLDSRVRRRLRRSHLSEEVNHFEQHKKQDSKMRQALKDLRRELRERDQAIGELHDQLEASRLGRIDMSAEQLQELQRNLEQAKKEIDELKATSLYTMSEAQPNVDMFDDDDDYDDQVLIEPADLNINEDQLEVEPQVNGVYATRALELSSQITFQSLANMSQTTQDSLADASQAGYTAVPDKISDQAVQRFKSEFEQLTEQLAQAQGAVRVIAIELQNLHIVAPGASSDHIITTLRHGFEFLREELENMFPHTTVGLTNAQLLRKVVQTIKEIMDELGDKVDQINVLKEDDALLRAEISGLIDRLSEATDKNKEWDQRWIVTTKEIEHKDTTISGLEDRVVTLEEATNNQDDVIRERDLTIYELKEEVEDKNTSLTRLRDAIEGYRVDVNKLTDTVTCLEQEHADRIAQLEHGHAAAVQDLEEQLATQTEGREVAEGEALQKSEYIEELEERVEQLDSDIENFTADMARLKGLLDQETALRKSTEQQRDEQEAISVDFGNQIERLEGQVTHLEAEVADFRANLESERTQRLQTEASLDEANERIEGLNSQVHNAGITANELRSKLFGLQQAKELAIAQLTEDAAAREEELETALGEEREGRQTAEDRVAALDTQCSKLQAELALTEVALEKMTREREALEVDRDEKVTQGNRHREDLAKKLAALETTSASTITSLQANITDLTNDLTNHRATIQKLLDNAAQAEEVYNSTLADRDATIGDLEKDLAASHQANDTLAKENESLAKRVENEAHELLNIMGAHAEEASNLRQAIASNDATISALQNNAAMRADEYTEQLADKTQEIEELRIMGDNRAELVVELQGQIEEMKRRFAEAEADTKATMEELTQAHRRLMEQNEQLSAALIKRNADALKAVQEMKVRGLEVKTTGVGNLRQVTNSRVTKVSERVKVGKKGAHGVRKNKRQWDSGFGMDENIENGEGVDEALLLDA